MHLRSYLIKQNICRQCGACMKACPQQAISVDSKKHYAIDPSLCDRCGTCVDACRFRAIAKKLF